MTNCHLEKKGVMALLYQAQMDLIHLAQTLSTKINAWHVISKALDEVTNKMCLLDIVSSIVEFIFGTTLDMS